jgi:hypothetical protein
VDQNEELKVYIRSVSDHKVLQQAGGESAVHHCAMLEIVEDGHLLLLVVVQA